MSGICGIVHRQADRPVDQTLLQTINNTMIHRGPDGEDYHLEPGTGLAARHLTIGGYVTSQPASDASGSIWALVNGAILNHAELRGRLLADGHTLQMASDAEVIATLYRTGGDSFPERLEGEFAIALWDSAQRRLLLVRDRLGVKPLYFAHIDGSLVFASELRAVMQHPAVSRELDMLAYSEYLTFQHSLAPRTLLKDIQKLPPGCMVEYHDGKLSTSQYWDLRFPDAADNEFSVDQHVERFREVFALAVRQRLPDGPIGCFLSGGMDTSSIVGMLSHLGVPEIRTYSGGYRLDESGGELSRAKIVADHFNTLHHELGFSAQDYADALPHFIRYMDDPVADEASLIRMLLTGRARDDVRVLLGGEGGDDVTAGYHCDDFCKRFDRLRRFQRLPRWLRCDVPALLSPFLPGRLRAWLARGNRDPSTIPAEEHYSMVWAFEADEKRRYFPALRDMDDHCHDLAREIYARSNTADPLSQLLYFYTKVWAAENLMMSADKMTMSHSVEFRAPFLDHRLAELCAAMPSANKVHREPDGSYTTKYILKRAMHGILPDNVIKMPKSPFQVPTQEWFQSSLAGRCRDVLFSESARTSGLYDIEQVRALFERHSQAPTLQTMIQIRNVLFFEMWRQLVLNAT
ncbi:MAG: asparagine synthase (glutamine-hydrolyzing) [Anaerolineae bacterium]|nr:asparagine synthase (glutamine-hydrolyzing) [Anaerolineae bacterium]